MKIAIAGYGVEGRSNYRYYSKLGHDITILDENSEVKDLPVGVPTRLGKDAYQNLDDFDMVVRGGASVPPKLKSARKLWSATNEFLEKCPAPVIGVTGTKGKGTTTSLIASILKAAGKTVHVVGNIGVAPLDALPDIAASDLVVYELSSFQLWDAERSPHIAVVLMIETDHLDVHASFDEYVQAKGNITRFQTENDTVVFAKDNPYSGRIAANSKSRKVAVQSESTFYAKDGFFWHEDTKICPTDTLKLPGTFNLDNACAAIAAAWNYTQDSQAIAKGLSSFIGLPHRLKFVRSVDQVAYYDDSIGTTIGSSSAAIHAFQQPKIIILGGSSKGDVDFAELANVAAQEGVKKAILIGELAPVIQSALEKHGVPFDNLGLETTMAKVVAHAKELAKPGDVVILSPACASFDMFKNYSDRGDQFVAAVNEL